MHLTTSAAHITPLILFQLVQSHAADMQLWFGWLGSWGGGAWQLTVQVPPFRQGPDTHPSIFTWHLRQMTDMVRCMYDC